MWTDRRRALLLAVAVAAGALLSGCAGDERDSFRIGVLTDCVGIYRSLADAELSGAQLPLVERGARLRGSGPADGLTSVSVAGAPVELVRACTETGEFSTMFEQVRRLVERESVDAVVAGALGVDGIGLREVAARLPQATFVSVPSGARETTLRRRASNLYRIEADHGQAVGGLATYAFRDLGWRRAAVIAQNWDAGWGAAAAFVAEFCSLGGAAAPQVRLDFIDPSGSDAQRIPADVDGVAVLTTPFIGSQGPLLRRIAGRLGSPSEHVVLGPSVLNDEAALRATGRALEGVVGASRYAQRGLASYVESYRAAFPGQPSDAATNEFVVANRNAVEVILQALERAEGDPGARGERLREALGVLETDLLGDPVRIDEQGQAIVSTRLVRIGPVGRSGLPSLERLRTVHGVDQSIGGLLDGEHRPGARDESCRVATPPPWAR